MNGRAFMLTRMNGAPTVDENDDVDCDAQEGRYRKSYVMEAEAALYMDLPPPMARSHPHETYQMSSKQM